MSKSHKKGGSVLSLIDIIELEEKIDKEEVPRGKQDLGPPPENLEYEGTDNAITVLERRYLKRDETGEVLEAPEDMFWRVAKTIARVEEFHDSEITEEEIYRIAVDYYEMMVNRDFMPNSPTLMNAGRELGQLSACFVLPIRDSMESIFETIKDAALIHKSGGGTGFSFSRIRPKNDVVQSTRGVSSGPISFMTVFNAATETIKQGGTRRGANMGILRVDHPDIIDFIKCKDEDVKLNNFNISVAVSGEFMKALENDDEYPLINPRTNDVVQWIDATEVFDLMVKQAYKNGEPGIIFLDRINEDNPTPMLGDIESTNPCLSGDTWVITENGPKQMADILNEQTQLVSDGNFWQTSEFGVFNTKRAELFEIFTDRGYSLEATSNHLVKVAPEITRYKIYSEWKKVSDLEEGDMLILSNNRGITWEGEGSFGDGYLLGILVGDGTFSGDRAVISVWGEENDKKEIRDAVEKFVSKYSHRSDFSGFNYIEDRKEHRLRSRALSKYASRYGIERGNKKVTPRIEETSSDFHRGFIRGIFDADGCVLGSQDKGVSIRLSQSSMETLQTIQRMLIRLGIASQIYQNRYPPRHKEMPDGKGGMKKYHTRANHELVISNDNIKEFSELIGFYDIKKENRLNEALSSYRRNLNRERFLTNVVKIKKIGVQNVYDVQIPGKNSFDANGIIVHNCGEQPLLPYESCNLGSINLAHMVDTEGDQPQINWDKLERTVSKSVRFLDGVIDANKYPLKKIEEMTKGNRKIGLGVMGFADMLFLMGVSYGSERSFELADEVMSFIQETAHKSSQALAEERGPFPNFKGSKYDVDDEPPIRNATLTTIAPTGTISIIAQCSSGVEPLFSLVFYRKVLDGEKLVEVHPIFMDVARKEGFYSESLMEKVAEEGSIKNIDEIPEAVREVFVTSHDITPEVHIKMQAVFQKYTENAVSKTINFKNSATVDDIRKAYLMAYEMDVKGLTVYRDGSREEQVLHIGLKEKEKEEAPQLDYGKLMPRERPEMTYGETRKIRTGCGSLYVTINWDDLGLFEVFANMGKAGGCAASQTEAISRLISLDLRAGIDPLIIVKHLKDIRCHKPFGFGENKILSCADAIAMALEDKVMELDAGGDITRKRKGDTELRAGAGACPECGGVLYMESGCEVCKSCGYSGCS